MRIRIALAMLLGGFLVGGGAASAADDEIVEGVVAVRAHHDEIGVEAGGGIDDGLDGDPAGEFGFHSGHVANNAGADLLEAFRRRAFGGGDDFGDDFTGGCQWKKNWKKRTLLMWIW